MNREDDQQLWDLLGKAAEPSVSPFFARNVTREIRQQSARRGWHELFTLRRLVPVAGCAAALLVATIVATRPHGHQSHGGKNPTVIAQLDAGDSDLVNDLDDLVDGDDDSVAADTAVL